MYGAGGIGSVLGGLLARANHDVTFLGREWHLHAIRRDGLRISGLWGEHRITGVTLTTQHDQLPSAVPFDWIFVCVKAHQTAEVAEAVATLVGPSTLVCGFQNGLGNYEALTALIPAERVALARVIFGVELEPGHAHVTVSGGDVLIGAPDHRLSPTRLTGLIAALQTAGIPTQPTSNIFTALWGKVLYNCALNGLSTLLEVPYGALADHPIAPRLIQSVITEVYQVAAARRLTLEPADAAGYLHLLFSRLIPATAAHRASMLQDIRRGHRTEINALNGAIVALGHQVGVPTPINALVTRLVHHKERFSSAGRPSERLSLIPPVR